MLISIWVLGESILVFPTVVVRSWSPLINSLDVAYGLRSALEAIIFEKCYLRHANTPLQWDESITGWEPSFLTSNTSLHPCPRPCTARAAPSQWAAPSLIGPLGWAHSWMMDWCFSLTLLFPSVLHLGSDLHCDLVTCLLALSWSLSEVFHLVHLFYAVPY